MATRKRAEVEEVPRLLDLDAEEASHALDRLPVKINGRTYHLRTPDDLAIVPRETLRVLLIEQEEISAAPLAYRAGDEGMHIEEREALLDDIERRIIALALVDAPDDLEMTPFQRNRLIQLFISGLDSATLVPLVLTIKTETVEYINGRIALLQRLQSSQPAPETSASPPPTNDDATAKPSQTLSLVTAAD